MARSWTTPIYVLTRWTGKPVKIDVTTSISGGLDPHQVVKGQLIPELRKRGAKRVLDFGAGALRHTFPLLRAGFQVCAVEFEEAFRRPAAAEALKRADRNKNFSRLIWPKDFLDKHEKYDAVLLTYVLQTMPMPAERRKVLKAVSERLRADSLLLYMSRFNQVDEHIRRSRISDGYFTWPDREVHSFYREFSTKETHEMMERQNLKFHRNWSSGGKEQVIVYEKEKSSGTWA